jgi:hypothetical protein
MPPEWDSTKNSGNFHPGLSRCSTLVSEQDHTPNVTAQLEKGDTTVFEASFVKKFSPTYAFKEVILEKIDSDAVRIRPTKQLLISSRAHLSGAIINGWACELLSQAQDAICNQWATNMSAFLRGTL